MRTPRKIRKTTQNSHVLGSGSHAWVFCFHHQAYGLERVAVKIFDCKTTYMRESCALRELKCQYIVPVLRDFRKDFALLMPVYERAFPHIQSVQSLFSFADHLLQV